MHNENNKGLFTTIENGLDMCLNILSLLMGYLFAVIPFESADQIVEFEQSTTMLTIFIIIMAQSFVFMSANLYAPIPFVRPGYATSRILKANIPTYIFVVIVGMLAYPDEVRAFMVAWLTISGVISCGILVFKKRMIIRFVVAWRKRNFKLKKVIIVGDNTAAAAEFVRQISINAQYAMIVVGYVGDKLKDIGCERLGSFADLSTVLDRYKPDNVVFAIDSYKKKRLIELVNICDDHCVKVYFLPVIFGFFKSPKQIESVGSVPIINIHSTPLDNRFNAFCKRVIDVVGSVVLILLTSPIMLVAAIGVRISSPGPIMFKQERVGKLGKPFTILKFRSMRVNVESDEAWSKGIDHRKTRFGNFLRMTSIDELPQLFNVLAGDMSLVGPRPEVPKFVEYFKDRIPLYMVKHYVKPGMTGLAQIKGLRGDTSISDRIHEDIEYIENWSLPLDISILFKTPFKAFNKQERYVDKGQRHDEEENEEEVMQTKSDVVEEKPAPVKEPIPKYEPAKGKILYAASTMSHINNFHLDYIAALREEGYNVKVLARGDGADYSVPFVKKYFSSANKACRVEIKAILERERFDVVILNTSLAAYHIRRCLPKVNRPKVINFVHGYLFSAESGFVKRRVMLGIEKWLAKRTDSVIVMNEADRQIAEKNSLASDKVYTCRGMGASVRDEQSSPEKLRHDLGCDDKFVMTFVGELSARKNQEFLILALNTIKDVIPNAVLWLVGDGLAKDYLNKLARRVDVSESVFLLGRRENACDYMRACDLYVSASQIEGMPFNLIEAMGCGKTVLASSVKGHTDLIEEGVSGYLFKPDSVKDFTAKVKAIHDGELKLDAQRVVERYRDFEKKSVFEDTLKVLKTAIVGEDIAADTIELTADIATEQTADIATEQTADAASDAVSGTEEGK